MGSFNIQNNVSTKTLVCIVEGNMTVQDAATFMNQYNHAVASISPSQYTLTLDCTKLKVSSKESQEKLAACFQMYKQSHFKQIVFHTGNNSILMMQLTRLAHATKLENFKVD